MKRTNLIIAGILAVLATIVYFASLASYAFPGQSANLIALWQGLDVSEMPRYPLMAVFAKLLGGGNMIAPICGIISTVCVFWLVYAFILGCTRDRNDGSTNVVVARIAAISASLVFMLSPAVRSAATHLEPRLFDLTWLLLSLVLALPFVWVKSANVMYPIFLGAMTAFGLSDSSLFLFFLPLLIVLLVQMSLHAGERPYMPVFLFLLVLAIVLPIALLIFNLPFVDFLRVMTDDLSATTSRQGWAFIVVFTTVPFIALLISSRRAFRVQRTFVQDVYHCAMSFVAILAIATPLAPAALMEPYGLTPVAASVFAACIVGCLLSYWWLNRRTAVGLISGSILAFVAVFTLVWNLFAFDANRGAFADKVASRMIAELGNRRWFVTDGMLDSHLKLVAARQGKKLHVISLTRDSDQKYIEELTDIIVAEKVGGSKNGSLRLSLSLGVLPFLQDWLASDPTAANEVAIYGAPDLWYSANLTPVPELLFFGADPTRKPDWSQWSELDKILSAPKGWGSYHDRKVTNPVDALRFQLRRHVGFVANNRGVWLQDNKRNDEAFKMYELVLGSIDRDNICALFNEVGMVGLKHPAALAKQRDLERLLKTAVDDSKRRYVLWRLGVYYGYIRNPEMFVRLGHAWAKSGRPGDALSQIRRAIDFVPTDKRAALLNMMAALYASENDLQKSRKIFESILAKNAKDHDALVGMMRLELADGNSTRALDYLSRAAETSGDGERNQVERALIAMMKNDVSEARRLLKKVTETNAKNLQAWSLLSAATMQLIDTTKDEAKRKALEKELREQILVAMEKQSTNPFDYYLQTTKGYLLLRQGADKRKEAREAFLVASKSRPDLASTHDMVLGLDISMDDKASAETHAKAVLRRNRNAPLANYVMGSLALGQNNLEDAEAYLRKAAEAPQPVVLAINDLAEVCRRKKNYSEAERFARKAIEKAPQLYIAWETLGSILMDQNKDLGEAESAIRKALDLSKAKNGRESDARILVSLARVQVRNRDLVNARVTVRKIQSRLSELNEYERRDFEKVKTSVR